MAQRVILDTDIGDDIDDAYALALIVASPELELLGVTTVFMNTVARARQARTLLAVAGRPEVPVAVGCGGSLSPRTTYDFDARQAYLEGRLPNQDATCLPEALLPPADPRHAIDYLVETLLAGDGDIIVLTIGAMTNLAMAMLKEPRILARIPRIVAMAGTFDRHMDEWNIRCDPVAAQIVLQSGVPVDLVPLDVTMQVRYEREQLLRLRDAHHPLAPTAVGRPRCACHVDGHRRSAGLRGHHARPAGGGELAGRLTAAVAPGTGQRGAVRRNHVRLYHL